MTHYFRAKYWLNLLGRVYADMHGYNSARFGQDVAAGLVTGIVAIPLSLALAIATGVPPVYGLYTASVAGLVASLFGGSRFSISGPAAAMVPILSGIVTEYGVGALPTIGLLAGVFLILMGIGKLGRLVQYVPLPVVLGFTAGVALTIFTGQLNGFLGLHGIHPHEHFHEKFVETLTHIPTFNAGSVWVGVLALVILIGLPKVRWLSKIPASFFAVVVTTLCVYFIPGLMSVQTIKEVYGIIPTGFHLSFGLQLDQAPLLAAPALKVAFLIAVESLLCAVVADKMTKTRHNSNVELVAQGVANIVSPFFSGIPATAVIARTGTSIKSGATSRVAGVVHGIVVLLFVLALATVGSLIPIPTLAAVLFVTAWKISEQKEIRHLLRTAPRADITILVLTFLLTVFVDLTVAVGFGMVLAMLLFFRDSSTLHAEYLDEKHEYASDEIRAMLRKHKTMAFVNLEGNLTMGAAHTLSEQIHLPGKYTVLVLRFREVQRVDLSGLEALRGLVEDLHKRQVKVLFTSMNHSLQVKMKKFGLLTLADHVYPRTARLLAELGKK